MENKRLLFITGVFTAMSVMLTACGQGNPSTPSAAGDSAGSSSNAQVVKVTATDYAWTLDKQEVKAGQPVKFVITDEEGAHGFSIIGTGVNQPLTPGSVTTVTWTPEQAGTYWIVCSQMCGSGHGNMKTQITVK